MANAPTDALNRLQSLRLWPGVVAVLLQWLLRFAVPVIAPGAMPYAILGGIVGGLVVIVWWAFFSRAPRAERWGLAALMILALAATSLILDASIATAGMGILFYAYAIPPLCLAFVVAALIGRHLSQGPRRLLLAAVILLACGSWALLRSDGISGGAGAHFAWRWSATPEERLLAQTEGENLTKPVASTAASDISWPGFRGPGRDGNATGSNLATDWSVSPPVELWRQPVGPGWSSFAVSQGRIYTQEQRGEEEIVACYEADSGKPVWRHGDPTRFWEANAGAGPRATPTLRDGYVYTFGATGILNALNASDGTAVWSRNTAADIDVEVPYWGFSGSPLVLDDMVIVAVGGALAAYDRNSGQHRWSGPNGGTSYSSPHLLTIDSVAQVLLLNEAGATSLAPADGALLWEHAWGGFPIVQPALTPDGDVLISVSDNSGIRRLNPTQGTDGWTVAEDWTSTGLKPYFNDFVVHNNHAFGFDGRILSCIDLDSGKRIWKGGRYGNGQLVLLPDQDLLLVLSEEGELALVKATLDQFTELARFPALEGKTWNHPVLVDDMLLVRNDREMAAFRLPRAGG
ncbi:MAG: PQQ-binding-like beta-propeller repeat protein [Candidatus Latescibacteria bacterium]|nr:PQQ-binding-like beta-propeller repeat protein [Candidatus Latescibacterota bacterium]